MHRLESKRLAEGDTNLRTTQHEARGGQGKYQADKHEVYSRERKSHHPFQRPVLAGHIVLTVTPLELPKVGIQPARGEQDSKGCHDSSDADQDRGQGRRVVEVADLPGRRGSGRKSAEIDPGRYRGCHFRGYEQQEAG